MQPADILRVATPADPQISPDGTRVAYTLTTVEGDANRTTIYLAPTSARANSRPAPLLPTGWAASTPRWSPDGKRLAFLSAHDGRDGIWFINIDDATRTPRFIAPIHTTNFHIAYAGESLAWSPDSRRIAYISTGAPDPMTSADATAPRVITRLQYKSRTAFSDDRRTHVFVTDIERPAPRKLTDGDYYDHAITWNPDGREIAFLSNREPEPEAINNSDIFAVNTDGDVRRITDTKGCEYEPAWSPDGALIAYTATKRPVTTIDSIAEDAHIWVTAPDGKSAGRELTAAQDRRVRNPRWAANDRLLFLANDKGRTDFYDVSLKTGRIRRSLLYFARNSQGSEMTSFTYGDAATIQRNAISPLRVARPFQISSFSIATKSAIQVRHSVDSFSRYPSPMAFTVNDSVTPAEVWFAFGTSAPVQIVSNHNEASKTPSRLSNPKKSTSTASTTHPFKAG
jgi:Tol biopolymer transport system component